MREIKFRAWDTVSRDMSVAFELDSQGLIDFGKSGWPLEHIRCLPGRFILMQFTGLKDKNGKEIYEGDIIQTPPIAGEKFNAYWEVLWAENPNEHMWGWMAETSTGIYALDKSLLTGEIVGNIYENPELLTSQ